MVMDIKSISKSKHLKAIILAPALAIASTAANAALIRYDFIERMHPVFPAGELYSGYYIFESETPEIDPSSITANFINPVREIGINFDGQSEVFSNCLSAICSNMSIVDSAEEHYNFTADLYDVTGTRALSFSLMSGDMYQGIISNPDQPDILQALTDQTYIASASNAGNISFEFEGNDGILYSDSSVPFSLTRVGEVPVPAAFWLFGSGLIGLAGIARHKKTESDS